MTLTIDLANGRRIGDGQPCFVIAEAGSNWRMGTPRRDRAMAFALIDAAVDARCDAVKFQTYRADTVYVADAGESDYLKHAGVSESINDIFEDLSMDYEMLAELAHYCERHDILFMSTPFSVDDADAVDPHVMIHKIASYEISHTQLQQRLAGTGKPIICSTGATTFEDIDYALETLRSAGAQQLALMQCTAKYPTPLENVNLRVIPELKRRYGVPVGLSDHSAEPTTAPAGAVAVGANLVEKHYTLHRNLPGPDHPFAVEPDELAEMVHAIRNTERALGSRDKRIGSIEEELYQFARRGLQATRAIARGDVLRLDDNMALLRPGKHGLGAHPRHLADIDGKSAARDIPAGAGIALADVK